MRIVRSGAALRLQLGAVEVQTLADLLTELLAELELETPAGPVYERLYPSAYADARAEETFRDMTETGLRGERTERAQQCLAEVVDAPAKTSALARRARHEIVLSESDGDRWMRVLNDLRLVIGTRLEVTEDDETAGRLDPDDPQALAYVLYGWLTAFQDTLVRVLMG